MGSIANTRNSDFHFFLRSISQRFTSISIFNSEFKCLHIHTQAPNNSVGLMHGLKTLKNFFTWDGTQVVVHNDPQLGCSRSDRIQFLFSSVSFHFCIEETFSLPWDFSKKIVKIPPIPIVENHLTNSEMLGMLTAQVDCPASLHQFFLETLQKIEKFQQDIRNILRSNNFFTDKDMHKNYLSASASATLKAIKSKTYMSAQIEYEWNLNSLLRIKTTTSEMGIRIDFQGTSNQSTYQLADSITDSICFQFFADYYQFGDLMNEATYSNFQIVKPTPSFVNSKILSNKLYSDLCGPDLIIQALLDCIAEGLTLKPYLVLQPHFQIEAKTQAGKSLEFSIPNARPQACLGMTYLFEPLLCSRPASDGAHIPSFYQFSDIGMEISTSQQVLRSQRSREINDYQALVEMTCARELIFSIAQPIYPSKVKSTKNKMMTLKPCLKINGEAVTMVSGTIQLKAGDHIEFKSGSIDFT